MPDFGPRPEFDGKDAEILAMREILYNQIDGPRVGDFLRVTTGFLRFTHDWGDTIQTTVRPRSVGYGDASFYLGEGYAEFSGSLDPAIKKERLRDTGKTELGSFWFFHHNWVEAHNGVYFKMRCRVFEYNVELTMSVYSEVKAAGGYISNHESDLYIEATEENTEILKRNGRYDIARKFMNEVTGKLCYDVPFAYDPFWEKRANG